MPTRKQMDEMTLKELCQWIHEEWMRLEQHEKMKLASALLGPKQRTKEGRAVIEAFRPLRWRKGFGDQASLEAAVALYTFLVRHDLMDLFVKREQERRERLLHE